MISLNQTIQFSHWEDVFDLDPITGALAISDATDVQLQETDAHL